ncbi:MAG: M56 family metallopeptidase, partial [Pseudomonadota bacterium]
MTDLFFLDDYQIEALLVCLVSSIVWAPIVLLVALSLAEKASGRALQAIWLGALLIAIAPSILAPGLAGIGISLRPGTEQLSGASAPNQSFTPAASISAFAKSDRRAAALVQQNTVRPSIQYGAAITARAESTRTQIASATPSTARAEKQSETSNPPILLEAEPAFVFPLVQRIEKMSKSDVTRTAALLYFYGIFLALLIWWAKAFGLSWVAFTAQTHRGDDLRKGVELWREKLSIARPPSLKKTRHVSSVCVIGFFRPVVLIPEGIDRHVTPEDLEMMCAHELAHISRRDPVLFLATSFVRSLFWFNPFVKTISKQVENAAEEAADSQVISRGVDRRRYAECFIKGLRFASEQTMRAPTFTPTFTPDERSGRRKRLNAILGRGKENKSRQPITFGMILGLGFAMAGAAMAQAALSVSPESAVNSPKVFKDLQAFFAEPVFKETTSEKPSTSTPPPAPSLAAVDRGAREAKDAKGSAKSTSTMFGSPSDGNRFSSIETERAKLGRNHSNAVDDLLSVGKRQLSYEAAWSRINPGTHHELEINAKSGTPVVAISAGTVCEVEPAGRSENGPYISVRHKGGLVSTYQNVTTSLVSPGDKIVSG